MTRPDHTYSDERIMRALRAMADDFGLVAAHVRDIAQATDLPIARTSQRLGFLRAKRFIERVQDGRGRLDGRTIYQVLA